MNGPNYLVFSIVGYRHLIIGYAKTVDEARKQIAKDFEANIEDVEYECTLTEFEASID